MDEPGALSLKVEWEDLARDGRPLGALDVEVSFRWGRWQGVAVAFTELRFLESFAVALRQFSRSLQGEVVFQAGSEEFKPGFGGFVRFRFRPADGRGHIACSLMLRNTEAPGRESTTLSIELRTELGLLDAFLDSLDRFLRDRTEAVLQLA